MPRHSRSFVSLLLATAGLLLGLRSSSAAADDAGSAKATPRRPNFLLILVDDQSPFDFRFYNPRSELHSPTLDRLAAQGMVVDGAY
ncbi:MAG: hypothetical protein ACKOTE_01860 [Opitutaceae bacterium]